MNALELLKADHAEVSKLFNVITHTLPAGRERLVDKVVREIENHSSVEEAVFYLACTQKGIDISHEIEEHNEVKELIANLSLYENETIEWQEILAELIETVTHHVTEEEGKLFKEVRKAFTEDELTAMGKEIKDFKNS